MLKTVFNFNINYKLIAGKVCYGKFYRDCFGLVAAVSDDKLLVHLTSDLKTQDATKHQFDKNILNINKKINSICCGKLNKDLDYDILIIGTEFSILAYDIQNNVELFYKEIPDGSNAVVLGEIGNPPKNLAISGGNCALQGFDENGLDSYWTVTGDNITSICVCDINKDGLNELITGSDGNEIRVFKDEAILFDIQEKDVIKCLCYLEPNYFAYALRNGTVGVYYNKERIWRIKSKKDVICIVSFDINNDGTNELITGWSNGKLDIREIKTGKVIYKDVLKESIAGIFITDFNLNNKKELIVVTVDGGIKGYQLNNDEQNISKKEKFNSIRLAEQEKIRELLALRNFLQLELRNYEKNNKIAEEQLNLNNQEMNFKIKNSTEYNGFGAIPANTQLKSTLQLFTGNDDKEACIELTLQTSNDTIIRAAVVFAEGIFSGESFVAHPSDCDVSNNLTINLKPSKNIALDLHVKAIIGYNKSEHYHIFELTRSLPKFCMFSLEKNLPSNPNGKVVYNINEKANWIIIWLKKNFLIDEDSYNHQNEILTVILKCLRTNAFIVLELNEKTNQFVVQCDSMCLVSELMQSLFTELTTVVNNEFNLNCISSFPNENKKLKFLINQISKLELVRHQLIADFADNSTLIKDLIVMAEDARLLNEFKLMKKYYNELQSMNKELFNGFRIRNQNQQELIDNLKEINYIIQHAANLRFGTFKHQIIQSCRNAIKQNNLNIISRIVVTGES